MYWFCPDVLTWRPTTQGSRFILLWIPFHELELLCIGNYLWIGNALSRQGDLLQFASADMSIGCNVFSIPLTLFELLTINCKAIGVLVFRSYQLLIVIGRAIQRVALVSVISDSSMVGRILPSIILGLYSCCNLQFPWVWQQDRKCVGYSYCSANIWQQTCVIYDLDKLPTWWYFLVKLKHDGCFSWWYVSRHCLDSISTWCFVSSHILEKCCYISDS